MASSKSRSSDENQELNSMRTSTASARRLSFQETVRRTQRLMRVLRTMNTLNEHRRPTYLGSNINESTSYQRRGA
ncbi:unnamed protein product, partial [Rotaria sordida]